MKKRNRIIALLLCSAALSLFCACGRASGSAARDDPEIAAFLEILEKLDGEPNLDLLSEPERVIYLVRILEDEVNNGGFAQYYYNSGGDHANEIVWAFETINAPAVAEICRKANSIFGDRVPRDWEERIRAFESLSEDSSDKLLTECDNAFYASEEELHRLEAAYVEAHAQAFGK